MIKKIILIALLVVSSYADSCWSRVELANFAQDEFSQKARFSIKDAVSCKPIANAEFAIGKIVFKTDINGIVTIPLPPENMDRELPITIKKRGYITANERIMVVFGSYWNNLFLMSKELPISSARFVLSWGNTPSDLDIHLKSSDYHISYRKVRSIKNRVKLDRDAREGYGPETITVSKLNKSEKYRVLVNRYSRSGAINNKAQVRVYLNNRLDRVVRLKNTEVKCIEVATIINNKVTYKIEELTDSECQ